MLLIEVVAGEEVRFEVAKAAKFEGGEAEGSSAKG